MERHDHGDRWDQGDIRWLAVYLEMGWTYERIGFKLGRTRQAVRSKARRLGLR